MVIVRNIREFTVAISKRLESSNWSFVSSYSRGKGMSFLLQTSLQGYSVEINIIPDKESEDFLSQIILDNRIYKVLHYKQNSDIEKYVDSLQDLLEKIRDLDIEIKFS